MELTILRDVRQMHTNCTSFYILEFLVHFVRSSAPLGTLRHRSYVYQRSVMYSELYYWPSFLRLTAVLTQIPLILFIPLHVFKISQFSRLVYANTNNMNIYSCRFTRISTWNRTILFISLAITMKTFCTIAKGNMEIIVPLSHHRMLILSLCTCFAWVRRDPGSPGQE